MSTTERWDTPSNFDRYFTKSYVADRTLVGTGTSPWIDGDDLMGRQDTAGMVIIGITLLRRTDTDALVSVHYDDQDEQKSQWYPPSDAIFTLAFADHGWKIDEITTIRLGMPTFSAHAYYKDLLQGVWFCSSDRTKVCGDPGWIEERWENEKEPCSKGGEDACLIRQQIADRLLAHHYCYGPPLQAPASPTWHPCEAGVVGPKGEHFAADEATPRFPASDVEPSNRSIQSNLLAALGGTTSFGQQMTFARPLPKQRVYGGTETERWMHEVEALLEAKVQQLPRIERSQTGGKVALCFHVNPQGRVLLVDYCSKSGYQDVDQLAMRALRAAQPFPPPPPGLVRGLIWVKTFDGGCQTLHVR